MMPKPAPRSMDTAKPRLLVVRHFRRPTGGNVTVRDVFRHALAYPRLETRIWFAPGSLHRESDLWDELPADRVVDAPDWNACDFVLVNGKDWRLLPAPPHRFNVIHLVQHLGYPDDAELRGYLARSAVRICVSEATRQSILPLAEGPIRLIPTGVDTNLFHVDGPRRDGAVLICASKAPELGTAIAERLAPHGIVADVLTGWVSRAEFAARLRAADIFVGLPLRVEGFYRPALEAMACGCAVVSSDATGNRDHCVAGETCLQPAHGDAGQHAACILALLADSDLRLRLRRNGMALAGRYSVAAERRRLHALFDELLAVQPEPLTAEHDPEKWIPVFGKDHAPTIK